MGQQKSKTKGQGQGQEQAQEAQDQNQGQAQAKQDQGQGKDKDKSKNKNKSKSQAQAQEQAQKNKSKNQAQAQVVMRQKKGKKNEKRPMSDPGVAATTAVEMNPNFHLKARDSQDLTGRHPSSASTKPSQMNPLSVVTGDEPAADYDVNTLREKRDENKNKVLTTAHDDDTSKGDERKQQTHDEALEQVLAVWPEYSPLKAISVAKLSKEIVNTIKQVYKRLFEQHSLIEQLSDEKHEALQSLRRLQEENAAHVQRLRKREAEVTQLKDEIEFCRQELRRHTDATVHRHGSDHRSDYHRDSPRAQSIPEEVPADQVTDPQLEKLRKREKEGIFQPTPLLAAEGMLGSKAALMRSPSALKPVVRNFPVAKVEPLYDNVSASGRVTAARNEEDMAVKVKRLEIELARERREKHALRSSSPREDPFLSSKPTQHSGAQSIGIDYILKRYTQLESEALNRLYQALNTNLNHVPEEKKYRFLGAVMMQSFEMARQAVQQVRQALAILLLNPVRPDLRQHHSGATGDRGPLSAGPSLGGGSRFDFPQRDARDDRKLAFRAAAAVSEIPDSVMTEVFLYLENMSRHADITRMFEEVVDTLCQEFPECTTPGLLNQSAFTRFLEECCRLSYQMNVMVPPVYVTTEINWRFEEKFHVGHFQQKVSGNSEIDFFIWPILLTKKHGEVLCKGRVTVKS